jgi:hypothetical protein
VQNVLGLTNEYAAAFKQDNRPEWNKILKTVLKSQPPRMEDVPSMADYLKVWGGLPSGVFVYDVANLLKYFMPSSRIVSGSIFKSLADMKFPMSQLPTDLVSAVLFTHAAADECVQDGFARFITKPDTTWIASEKNRKDVMEVDGIIKRVREITSKLTSSADTAVLLDTHTFRGQYMIDVVRVLLDKNKDDKTPLHLKPKKIDVIEDLTQKYVEQLYKTLKLPQPAPIAEKKKAKSSTDQAAIVAPNVVTYDDNGDTLAIGRNTAINKGYKVGSYFAIKRSALPDATVDIDKKTQQQWKLVGIEEDGAMELANVAADGSIGSDKKAVPLDDFLTTYQECKAKQFLCNYPASDAMHDHELQKKEVMGITATLLCTLMRKHRAPNVKILALPAKAVYASAKFEVGEYVAVPASNNFSNELNKEMDVRMNQLKAIQIDIAMPDRIETVYIKEQSTTKEFAAQFWNMARTENRNKANVHICLMDVSFRPPTTAATNTNKIIVVKVPCAVNFRTIDTDAEVMLYAPKLKNVETSKKQKSTHAVLEQKGAKKSKVQ